MRDERGHVGSYEAIEQKQDGESRQCRSERAARSLQKQNDENRPHDDVALDGETRALDDVHIVPGHVERAQPCEDRECVVVPGYDLARGALGPHEAGEKLDRHALNPALARCFRSREGEIDHRDGEGEMDASGDDGVQGGVGDVELKTGPGDRQNRYEPGRQVLGLPSAGFRFGGDFLRCPLRFLVNRITQGVCGITRLAHSIAPQTFTPLHERMKLESPHEAGGVRPPAHVVDVRPKLHYFIKPFSL